MPRYGGSQLCRLARLGATVDNKLRVWKLRALLRPARRCRRTAAPHSLIPLNSPFYLAPEVPKPWQTRVSRLRHRAGNVEMEHRLRRAGTNLRQSPPSGIAHTLRASPAWVLAHEVDVRVVAVCRPVALEVIKERWPIGFESVGLKVPQQEGEAVVDADD